MLLEGIKRRHLREFRAEAMAVVLVYAAAGFAYGRHVWMLEAALAARGVLISFADNAYHYGTRLDARLEAMNLRLPRPLAQFVLAFNLHSVTTGIRACRGTNFARHSRPTVTNSTSAASRPWCGNCVARSRLTRRISGLCCNQLRWAST
jgi:hypothetical protein